MASRTVVGGIRCAWSAVRHTGAVCSRASGSVSSVSVINSNSSRLWQRQFQTSVCVAGSKAPDSAAAVLARDEALRSKHGALAGHAAVTEEALEVYRKRCIYRSKQRGWLEVDLLLGTFATNHVPTMSVEELKQYERILNCETIDIYNYICGKGDIPEEVNNSVLKQLQEYAESQPFGKASPEGYATAKKMMSN